MSYLDEFRRNQRFTVCVDSDGCAMDTMNIKHIRCFGPCMVEEWGLSQWRDPILVNREAESWRRFIDEALGRFLEGGYAGEYQARRRREFNENLGI